MAKFKFWVAMAVMCGVGSPETYALTVQFDGVRYFEQEQFDKLQAAKKVVDFVINTQAFKERILGFEYQSQRTFVQNNGLTNQQVFDLLMTGAEKYPRQSSPDGVMNFDLELYSPRWYQSNNVLGYTNQNTQTIFINRNFFSRAEIFEIAMNLTHEWCHKVGFEHDSRSTARRPFSVPYGVGYIIRDLAQTFFQE
jgi:hypothetical protein